MPNSQVVSKTVIFFFFATILRSESLFFFFFFPDSLMLGPLKICWSTGGVSFNYGAVPLQESGNRVPKNLPPARNEPGLGPVPVHMHFVSAWTHSLGSWACCKWSNFSFYRNMSRRKTQSICEHSAITVVGSVDCFRIHTYGSSQSCCFLISVAIIPEGVKPSGFAQLAWTFFLKQKEVFFSIPLCHNQRIK